MRNFSSLIDVGFTPPLDLSGKDTSPELSHQVNSRWLVGTILTAVFGTLLLVVAIASTSERKTIQIADTLQVFQDQKTIREKSILSQTMRRSDKLVQSVDIASAKRSFRAPVILKIGDKEIIKTRSYTRVAVPLALVGLNEEEIPSFNPIQLISEATANRSFDKLVTGNDVNAQVTLQTRDLISIDPTRISALSLTEETALEQVRQAASQVPKSAPLATPQSLLAKAMRIPLSVPVIMAIPPQTENSFSRIEVKLIQENVSSLEKTVLNLPKYVSDEKVVTVHKADTFESILKTAGVSALQAHAVFISMSPYVKKRPLAEGDRIKLTFAGFEETQIKNLVRLSIYGETDVEAVYGQKDNGDYVNVPLVKTLDVISAGQVNDDENGLSVFKSIYETALKQGTPRFLIDELVRVYSYDVDFQRRAQTGDAIEFFYAEPEDGDKGRGELLYAAINLGGEKKNFYRFQSADDNMVDFYDNQGRSARKFLLRMPLADGQMRSGFGYRRHPILGYSKMHTGTDWANKVGTPIFAAGNGTIIKSGWASGYGNHIEIEHLNGYITTYSHMSAYGRGTELGTRVRQGQVIGYLGSTGLSTGPHLHYEVIVNDNFVDPMAIKLPRGRELDGRQLFDFKREREKVDQLMLKAQSKARMAQSG